MTDSTSGSFPLKFMSKIEFMRLVDLLDDFSKLCDKADIKFGKYNEDQLLQFLFLYKNYKTGDKPPF